MFLTTVGKLVVARELVVERINVQVVANELSKKEAKMKVDNVAVNVVDDDVIELVLVAVNMMVVMVDFEVVVRMVDVELIVELKIVPHVFVSMVFINLREGNELYAIFVVATFIVINVLVNVIFVDCHDYGINKKSIL